MYVENSAREREDQHASVADTRSSAQANDDGMWDEAGGERESREVFSFPPRLHDLPPVAVRALWEYSLSRGVRRSCTDLGERVLFREGGRARGGRRSRVPTGAAVRSAPIGSEGTGFPL